MDPLAELMLFGKHLRRVREQQRMSVAELATRTGMSTERITRLEAGLSDPRYDGLLALCRGLGVELSTLIPDDVPRRATEDQAS